MAERIDIIIREDGSREVAKRIGTIGVAADSTSGRITKLNKVLGQSAGKKAAAGQRSYAAAVGSAGTKAAVGASKVRKNTDAVKKSGAAAAKATKKHAALAEKVRSTATAYTILDGPLGGTAGRLRAISTAVGTLNPLLVLAGLAVAALTFGLGAVIRQGKVAEQQLARIQGVITATGGAAGETTKSITQLANEIARSTLASVEGVREASAILLTFRSVAGDTFGRTLKVAQDLASVFGGDLKSQTLQVAKALEDPIRGLTQLRRVGVIFSTDQENVIKALTATGKTAAAQSIILDELEKQVGGAGLAEGTDTLAGAFDTLGENFKILSEVTAEETGLLGILSSAVNATSNAVENASIFVGDLGDSYENLTGPQGGFLGTILQSGEALGFFIRKGLDALPLGAFLKDLYSEDATGFLSPSNIRETTLLQNAQLEVFNDLIAAGQTAASLGDKGIFDTQNLDQVAQSRKDLGLDTTDEQRFNVLFAQQELLKSLEAQGIAVNKVLSKKIFSTLTLGDVATVEKQAQALKRLNDAGVLTAELQEKILNSGTDASLKSTIAQDARARELRKKFERDIENIAIDGAKKRAAAVAQTEAQAATANAKFVIASGKAAQQEANDALAREAIAGAKRVEDARLQSTVAGFDKVTSVLVSNLKQREVLIRRANQTEISGIKDRFAVQLDATNKGLEAQRVALLASLEAQNKIVRESDATIAASKQLAGLDPSKQDQIVDPADDLKRLGANNAILVLNEKLLAVTNQINAARSQSGLEENTALAAQRLKLEEDINAVMLERERLFNAEVAKLKTIVDSTKTRITLAREELAELRRLASNAEALQASGISPEELRRTFAILNEELQREMDRANEIVNEFATGIDTGLQGAFSSFIQDTEGGLDALRTKFADVITGMAADAIAANLFGLLFGRQNSDGTNDAGIFGGRGLGDLIQGTFRSGNDAAGTNNNGTDGTGFGLGDGTTEIGGFVPGNLTSGGEKGTTFNPVITQDVGDAGGSGGGGIADVLGTVLGDQGSENVKEQEGANKGFLAGLKGVFDKGVTAFGGLFDGFGDVLGSIFSAFGGGGGEADTAGAIFGIVASAFGGGASAGAGASGGGGSFASGGVLGANMIGLVGEKGPEFISAGPQPVRITPPAEFRSGSSGGGGGDLESRLDELIQVTKEQEMTVLNQNIQDPENAVAGFTTRKGIRLQRNRQTADVRQNRRALGIG